MKICGLKRPDDAELAVQLGAWALGMIMTPKSARYLPPEDAAELVATHRRSVETVGVFVDAKLDHVTQVADAVGFSMIQLHGDEGQQYCEEIARRTGCRVIKAFRVRDRSVLAELGKHRYVDFHLLDTYKAGVPGGTGEVFDWSFLSQRTDRVPLILSGGLNPENVGSGIATVTPYAIDLSSGVETEPGVKDHDRMRELFDAVHAADELQPTDEEAPVEALTGLEEQVLTIGRDGIGSENAITLRDQDRRERAPKPRRK
ncbi:MAG: phosphoribosylanthranilate isomerase [Solirubrobacterales bacterium]